MQLTGHGQGNTTNIHSKNKIEIFIFLISFFISFKMYSYSELFVLPVALLFLIHHYRGEPVSGNSGEQLGLYQFI